MGLDYCRVRFRRHGFDCRPDLELDMKHTMILTTLALALCACEPSSTVSPGYPCPGVMEPHEAIQELADLTRDIEMIRKTGDVPLELLARAASLAQCRRGSE